MRKRVLVLETRFELKVKVDSYEDDVQIVRVAGVILLPQSVGKNRPLIYTFARYSAGIHFMLPIVRYAS